MWRRRCFCVFLPALCACVIDSSRNLKGGLWRDRTTKRRSASVTEWGTVETDKRVKVASRTWFTWTLCRVTQRLNQTSDEAHYIWSEERKGVRERLILQEERSEVNSTSLFYHLLMWISNTSLTMIQPLHNAEPRAAYCVYYMPTAIS